MKFRPDLRKLSILTTCFILLNGFFMCGTARGEYEIPWRVLDSGGTTKTGGAFSLTSSIGQVAPEVRTGGAYRLNGGYLVITLRAEISSRDVIDHLLQKKSLSGDKLLAADANSDGIIDVGDVITLIPRGK